MLLYQVAESDAEVPELQAWGRDQLQRFAIPGVETEASFESGPPVRKVLDKSRGFDIVVVGGQTSPRIWAKGLLGPKTQEITDRVAGNVLIVRSGRGPASRRASWLGRRFIQIRRYIQPD